MSAGSIASTTTNRNERAICQKARGQQLAAAGRTPIKKSPLLEGQGLKRPWPAAARAPSAATHSCACLHDDLCGDGALPFVSILRATHRTFVIPVRARCLEQQINLSGIEPQ